MRKTDAQYKADERERKKSAGLVKWELWIRPEWKPKIIDVINKIRGVK